jgi:hypothetical protein
MIYNQKISYILLKYSLKYSQMTYKIEQYAQIKKRNRNAKHAIA